MNQIPPRLRQELSEDTYYRRCARYEADAMHCGGRITWEHALLYAGKQIQEKFAIIPLCYQHHLGLHMNKRENIRIALERATEADKKKYPLLFEK